MFFARNILVIDNDVLVNFVELYANKIDKIFSHLFSLYSHLLIPETILNEFECKKGDKKRNKLINSFFEKYQNFIVCPIKVSKNEKQLLSEIHEGEADAYLQIQKFLSSDQHAFKSIRFLTADNGAIRFFEKQNIDLLKYDILINQLKEVGIVF